MIILDQKASAFEAFAKKCGGGGTEATLRLIHARRNDARCDKKPNITMSGLNATVMNATVAVSSVHEQAAGACVDHDDTMKAAVGFTCMALKASSMTLCQLVSTGTYSSLCT